jgi:hypothetical protein
MSSSRRGASLRNAASGPASADFEHVIDLPLTARRFLASLLRGLTLLLADEGKSGAKVLVLDNGRLRNLTQLVAHMAIRALTKEPRATMY